MLQLHDADLMSFVDDVKRRYEQVSEEYRNLHAPVIELSRQGRAELFYERLKQHGENGWTPSWQIGTDEPNFGWMTYSLKFDGWFPSEASTKYPHTMELLSHPAFETCGFSLLRPLTVVGPHAHSRLGGDHLTLHLALDAEPGRSYLALSGTFLEERNGEAFVFDGSREHFAVNAGLRDRVILYAEFDRAKL